LDALRQVAEGGSIKEKPGHHGATVEPCHSSFFPEDLFDEMSDVEREDE